MRAARRASQGRNHSCNPPGPFRAPCLDTGQYFLCQVSRNRSETWMEVHLNDTHRGTPPEAGGGFGRVERAGSRSVSEGLDQRAPTRVTLCLGRSNDGPNPRKPCARCLCETSRVICRCWMNQIPTGYNQNEKSNSEKNLKEFEIEELKRTPAPRMLG